MKEKEICNSKGDIMDFRKKVLNCLGKFPEKVETKGKIISSRNMYTHILKFVQYQVEPDEFINAYLLLPKKLKNKNPAIIASHQHAGQFYLGKSEPAGLSKNSMYHYGLELCKRGYVVLCPDHLGFEDRRPPEFKRIENKRNLEAAAYERFLFCKYILKGSTLQSKYLSDLLRGVDFLESLDFVDVERIGAIGHSLGGQETLWLTWFDDRIKTGVSSCGFSEMKTVVRDRINHNYAAFTYGLLEIGDISDIVCDIAPRPFMMTNGSEDEIFPVDGVERIADKAGHKYEKLKSSDKFKQVLFNGKHSFPQEIRKEAYKFIDRFLLL